MGVGHLSVRGLVFAGLVTLTAGAGDEPGAKKGRAPSEKDQAVLGKLDEPIALIFKDSPLGDVFRFIKAASAGPCDPGIPIYVDPEGLKRAKVTLETRVTVDSDGVPLKTSLGKLLGPLGLTWRVEDGLLVITAHAKPGPGPKPQVLERGPETDAILAAIERPLDLKFSNAPLEDVLKFIKSATEGPNGPGIPIYVDPVGLDEAGKTVRSGVTIDVKGEPIKVSLKTLLKPLGLTYVVKDGLLKVTSESVDDPGGGGAKPR